MESDLSRIGPGLVIVPEAVELIERRFLEGFRASVLTVAEALVLHAALNTSSELATFDESLIVAAQLAGASVTR